MTTTAAYPTTMTELRGEPAHSSLWPSYGSAAHLSSRLNNPMDAGFPSSSAASSHAGRPRSDHPSVDHPYPYSRYPQDEPDAYSRQPHTTLASQHSFPNSLKRSFSQSEGSGYEIVQDLREDGSRITVNQDHKLLAFRRSQDKHTVLDQHGRVQSLELSAQLHGMFFLSEMPSNTSDGSVLQPELTCYRRNLFQISGSFITPRGQISIVTEAGESVPVSNMEVTVSAIESVDGNPVRLIVIPWKTPPPNSPEVSQGPDQEPPSLPLLPLQDDGVEAEGEYAVYPIGWRRLQFRIATANNGRRKELQQHFVLHLKVYGTLANGTKVVVTESTTAPIVVRGRSPRNFSTRKEIPLLGSSAGSRGQALVETGLGVVAGAIAPKAHDSKARPVDMQVPRTAAFTFSPPKPPGPQLNSVRSNSYSSWSGPSAGPMPQIHSSGPGGYPATTISTDPYPKVSLAGTSSFSGEQSELPTSMAPPVQLSLVSGEQPSSSLRSQYTYVHTSAAPPQLPVSAPAMSSTEAMSVPRYIDSARPSKSPRHADQQSVHGPAASDTSSEYRFGSYGGVSSSSGEVTQSSYNSESSSANPPRDYYPPPNTWTTSAPEHSSSAAYASGESRPFAPIKTEPTHPTPPPVYEGGHRGSFDAMNNYSWSGN
jgi:hypothetical protein